jgi:hypothetical protein
MPFKAGALVRFWLLRVELALNLRLRLAVTILCLLDLRLHQDSESCLQCLSCGLEVEVGRRLDLYVNWSWF